MNHPFLCFFLLSEEITLSEALHLARVRPSLNGSNLDWKEKKRRRIEKKRGFPTLIPPQQKQSAVAPHPFACRSKPQAKYNMRKSLCYFLRSRVPGRRWHDVFLSHSEDKSARRQRHRERHRRNQSSRIGKEDWYREWHEAKQQESRIIYSNEVKVRLCVEVGGNKTYAGLKLVLAADNRIVNLNSFTALHYFCPAVTYSYSSTLLFKSTAFEWVCGKSNN